MPEIKTVPAIRFNGFSDDWEQHKLGECFSERIESDPNGELISVTINSGIKKFSELGRHDNSNDDKSKYKKVVVGDIAYNSMRMWQGASGYSPYTGIVSPAYTVITPLPGIDSRFFAYMFKRGDMIHVFQIRSQGITSDNWNLKFPVLREIDVLLPEDIKEQQAVSSLLANIDNLITLHQSKYEKLVKVKKSMLNKMFPQGDAKVPEIRFAGFYGDWKQCKLGEVASSFEYGLNAAAKEFDGENKYLRITDIDDSSRAFKDDDLTSPDTDLTTARGYQLHDGEIVFARTGASVGKTFIYRESDGLVYFAGFLIRAKIKPEYDSEFIFQNTLGAPYEKYILVTSQRSGQPGVNAQEYSEYTFLAPDYAEQKKIGGFLRQIDDLISLHQRKLEKLKQLKTSFLEKMFV